MTHESQPNWNSPLHPSCINVSQELHPVLQQLITLYQSGLCFLANHVETPLDQLGSSRGGRVGSNGKRSPVSTKDSPTGFELSIWQLSSSGSASVKLPQHCSPVLEAPVSHKLPSRWLYSGLGILHTGAAQEFQYQGRTKGSHGFTRRVRSTGKERRNTIVPAHTRQSATQSDLQSVTTNWSTRKDEGQQIYYISWVNQAG